jgi:hypothetical protein
MDFERLYDSLHNVVGDEGEFIYYETASLRVLGVCYDIRHALMGDREIEFVDNGMDEAKMRWMSAITPDKNVYLKIKGCQRDGGRVTVLDDMTPVPLSPPNGTLARGGAFLPELANIKAQEVFGNGYCGPLPACDPRTSVLAILCASSLYNMMNCAVVEHSERNASN